MAPAFPGVAMPPALLPSADMLMGDEDALKWTKIGQTLFLERSADEDKRASNFHIVVSLVRSSR